MKEDVYSAMALLVLNEDSVDPPYEVVCFNGLDDCLKKYLKERWDYKLSDYSLASVRQAERELGIRIAFPPFSEGFFDEVFVAKADFSYREPNVYVEPYQGPMEPSIGPFILTRSSDDNSGSIDVDIDENETTTSVLG